MKKLLKWLLAVVGVLVVTTVVLLYNPGLLRGPIGNFLSKASGYSISLEGDLEIDLGKQLSLDVGNIHVSNTEQENGQNLVTLDRLKLILVTSSLFEDTLLIEHLEIDSLTANLEISEDRTGNWEISKEPAPPDAADKSGPVAIVKNIQISNTTINYQNRLRGQSYTLAIESFEQAQNADGMLHVNLDGSLNDRPVEYYGLIGTYDNLLAGRDISFSGEGQVGSLNITGEGRIDDLLAPKHPQFNLQMEGPEIDKITAMLGFDDLGSGGFTLRARGGVVNDQYEASIHGDIGDLSLNISAQASSVMALDAFDLDLAVNGPSLGAVTHSFGINDWPEKPFSLEGKVKRVNTTLDISRLILSVGGSHLTLDALLSNFPDLQASRIKLLLEGDDIAQFRELLGIKGIATGPFEARGSLDVTADGLELVQVSLETSLGKASLSGTLGTGPSYRGTKLHVHLDGNNAHTLVSAFGVEALPEEPFNLDTHIELVEEGVQIERGVLVTIDDDRLELGGLIVLEPSGIGSDLELKISGQNLAQMLQRQFGDFEIPARPYALGGRVRLLEDSIELQDVRAEFEGIKLSADGLLRTAKQFDGTAFDFKIEGEDISSLGDVTAVGKLKDVFIPGQGFQATGNFGIENRGWRLKKISGQVGETDFKFNGLINPLTGWTGTDVHISIQGPDLNRFIVRKDGAKLPSGPFYTGGQVVLADDKVRIREFGFETTKSKGEIDLDIGWPFSETVDINFDVMLEGDDIRQFLPRSAKFEPALTSFNIQTKGHKLNNQISVQQFEATLGNLAVTLEGEVIEDPSDENVDMTFRATSKDLSALGRLNGEPLPAMAMDLSAEFKGNARQFVLKNLRAALGESKASGVVDVSLAKPRPTINLVLRSDLVDIRPFIKSEDTSDPETTTDAGDTDRFIKATPLPLDALASLDGIFDIKIAKLRHKNSSLENVVLDAILSSGKLEIKQLAMEGPRGKFKSGLTINPTGSNKADVHLSLHADELSLNLTGQPVDSLDTVPVFDVNLNVLGNGGDLQELAASLNGSLQMGSEGGVLEGVDLSILDFFILDEVLGLIMPKTDQSNNLDLTCAAVIVDIENGKMKTKPAFAFTTKEISLIAKGSVNLKTEALKMNFNATPNNALRISASELFNPYILVGGTLANPAVGLDPGKAIVHGGAAIGTAGISILAKGLLDRIGNITPLCKEMLNEIQKDP